MSEGQFKLTMVRGWEYKLFQTLEAGALVAEVTGELRDGAIRDAPRRKSPKSGWNMIKKNVSAYVERDAKGYYGNVVLELNEKVRHALLQEFGWTDRGGRRHPGRKYLKDVLLKARMDD